MISQDVRRKFLKYFENKGHTIVPSSPVVPFSDPTLLFINAGMNQFKDVFLGNSIRDYTRATSCQKCIRVGGKHNDLENVGHTARHLTFFEMLGNFSFGDYFKEDAIQFSWEVSTEIFGFDPELLWPTVYELDDETFELWTKYVPAEKITRFGEKDNFWMMGDTGPCGPCSELYYDMGQKFGDAPNPLEDVDEKRYLEFWNLVFMQYNRNSDGTMVPLPKPSIDTGAGLERIVSLKLGADNVFETDILKGLIHQTEKVTGVSYENNPAFHVIADHLRSLSFAIADGVQPSNVDRGYVLRKVLRRAVRYGRSLGMDKPFLGEIVPELMNFMGEDFPELVSSKNRIQEILTLEEEAFIRTLRRGGNILGQIIEQAEQHGNQISGDDAFKLKDTYGLPLDEITLLAKDAELTVDTNRFEELEEDARERSRRVHKTSQQIASENLFADYLDNNGPCDFTGYKEVTSHGKVTAIVMDGQLVKELPEGSEGLIVLDQTPFYAEMGGQIGDTGKLESESVFFEVDDCLSPFKGVIGHVGKLTKGMLRLGDTLSATIDSERRQKIANNHTATHLLHWALQKVLGEHVRQAGSVVDPNRLRFDFSHHKGLSSEEIQHIEDLVNTRIRENLPVTWYELPFSEVQKRQDIKQFFGEKYNKTVRVVDIDFSKELCGGTHTSHLGNIGYFRIAKEGSIAAGIRRIEAVTGYEAEMISREEGNLIEKIAEDLKTQPKKLGERIEKLLEENRQLNQQLKDAQKNQLQTLVDSLLTKVETIDEMPFLASEISVKPEDLRDCAESALSKMKSGIVILGAPAQDKCYLIARVSDDLVSKGIKANEIIKEISPIIQGGGGGRPNNAQAGGKSPENIGAALEKARELFIE